MGVHVNEVHTDVTTDGAQGSAPTAKGDRPAEEERWREAKGRTEQLMRRVRAEGFSD
jgi:hypothetical protein